MAEQLIDYPELAQEVADVIEGTGRDINFVRNSETPVDPAKPWRKYDTDLSGADGTAGSDITAKAVQDMYTVEEQQDNQNIRLGDSKFYVSALTLGASVDLREYDRVIDSGVSYSIVEITPIKPGDVNLLYILQVRR